jgi:hypothetical protein
MVFCTSWLEVDFHLKWGWLFSFFRLGSGTLLSDLGWGL